jgi:hypothetical protein
MFAINQQASRHHSDDLPESCEQAARSATHIAARRRSFVSKRRRFARRVGPAVNCGALTPPRTTYVVLFDDARRRALVRAALRAAAERPDSPFVLTALPAAAERWAAVRREAARLTWREIAPREAVLRGSCASTRETARETRGRRRVLRLC